VFVVVHGLCHYLLLNLQTDCWLSPVLTSNNVETTFDFVAKNGNIVEASGNRVASCFDNVASTLFLVWTGLRPAVRPPAEKKEICKKLHMAAEMFSSYYDYVLTVDSSTKTTSSFEFSYNRSVIVRSVSVQSFIVQIVNVQCLSMLFRLSVSVLHGPLPVFASPVNVRSCNFRQPFTGTGTGGDGNMFADWDGNGRNLEITGKVSQNGNYLIEVGRNGSTNYIPAHLYHQAVERDLYDVKRRIIKKGYSTTSMMTVTILKVVSVL